MKRSLQRGVNVFLRLTEYCFFAHSEFWLGIPAKFSKILTVLYILLDPGSYRKQLVPIWLRLERPKKNIRDSKNKISHTMLFFWQIFRYAEISTSASLSFFSETSSFLFRRYHLPNITGYHAFFSYFLASRNYFSPHHCDWLFFHHRFTLAASDSKWRPYAGYDRLASASIRRAVPW